MNILRLVVQPVKLLYKKIYTNFQCHLQCIGVILSIFKKITYIHYRTKNSMSITKTCTVSLLGKRVENVQIQETIADDAFLGPQSGMDKYQGREIFYKHNLKGFSYIAFSIDGNLWSYWTFLKIFFSFSVPKQMDWRGTYIKHRWGKKIQY